MSEQAPSAATAPEAGDATSPTPTEGATPPGQLPSEPSTAREAPEATHEPEDPREAGLGEEGQRLLRDERKRAREAERRARTAEAALKERTDADKSDIERVTEERDGLRTELAQMRRVTLQTQVAAEAGIPQLAHRLTGDDVRSMRADAAKFREELGLNNPGMDGGVRSMGVPPQPQSMDDLIRGSVRR